MGLFNNKKNKIKKLEKENTLLKEKLLNKKKKKENVGLISKIGNFLKSKKRKDAEAEIIRLKEENKKLEQNQKTPLNKSVENAEDKTNEITGDLWEKISEISDNMNSTVFNGVDVANDKGNKMIDKLKQEIDKYSKQANNMKLEEVLSNNFNESLFIKSILEGKINFTFKGERKIYDFLEQTGTKYIWKSDWEYFEFTLLKNIDKTAEFIFKINHIDVKVTMTHVNYNRLYNAIVHKKEENQLILTE